MKETYLLSKDERGLFFRTASDIKKMPKGAELIAKIIEKNGFQEIFKVPKKWIYVLPDQPKAPKGYMQKKSILVEEDAIVPAMGPFVFFDHARCKGILNTYSVVAVNAKGDESAPIMITLG